jgi:hypothetical protein
VAGWTVSLYPQTFACNVCRLVLHGPDELRECGLPSARFDVVASDLGEDFNPDDFALRYWE